MQYSVLLLSTEYIFHTHLSTAIYIHMQSMCYMFYRVVLQKWSEVQAVAVVVDVSNSSYSHRSQYNHGTMILVFPKEKSAFEFYFVLRKLIKTPSVNLMHNYQHEKSVIPKENNTQVLLFFFRPVVMTAQPLDSILIIFIFFPFASFIMVLIFVSVVVSISNISILLCLVIPLLTILFYFRQVLWNR